LGFQERRRELKILFKSKADSILLDDLETSKTSKFFGYFKIKVLGKVDCKHVKEIHEKKR
jgi:nicotinate-nucleotide pyrophosphorylase